MDLESTQGHHRLLTKYTGEGREGGLPYLGVEARRRRREETLVRLGWTPGPQPSEEGSGGFADGLLGLVGSV